LAAIPPAGSSRVDRARGPDDRAGCLRRDHAVRVVELVGLLPDRDPEALAQEAADGSVHELRQCAQLDDALTERRQRSIEEAVRSGDLRLTGEDVAVSGLKDLLLTLIRPALPRRLER